MGIVFYRAHALAGNTGFVETLADAVDAAGGDPLPIFCGSLRGLTPGDGPLDLFARCDALVVTVLAAGGRSPPTPPAVATRTPGTSARWPPSTCR